MLTRRGLLLTLPASLIPVRAQAAAMPLYLGNHDRDALVRVVISECRGEHLRGQIAVCDVVFNRVVSQAPLFIHDRTIAETCYRSGQFSCWPGHIPDAEYDDMLNLVELAYTKYLHGQDYSRGSTFFCTRHVHPYWISEVEPTVTIGRHRFFKLK
jgi:spore germination cell wall hydrolase CwlJ-like protein